MYSTQLGRFSTTDPSRKSIQEINPQSWNRYAYCYNNPLAYTDENGRWPPETHDYIIKTAFNNINTSAIALGSRNIDGNWKDPKTLYEKSAYQHAMTPGAKVKELGSVEKAQQWARNKAVKFIDENLKTAKTDYDQGNVDKSLTKFGEAMHPVMDNWSPTHTGFQVYDNGKSFREGAAVGLAFGGPIAGPLIAPAAGVTKVGIDQGLHWAGEQRPPTQDEMNSMIDEMREQYRRTYGQQRYEEAVSPEQREETRKRLEARNGKDILM